MEWKKLLTKFLKINTWLNNFIASIKLTFYGIWIKTVSSSKHCQCNKDVMTYVCYNRIIPSFFFHLSPSLPVLVVRSNLPSPTSAGGEVKPTFTPQCWWWGQTYLQPWLVILIFHQMREKQWLQERNWVHPINSIFHFSPKIR